MKFLRIVAALAVLLPAIVLGSITSQVDKTPAYVVASYPSTLTVTFPFQLSTDLTVLDLGPAGAPYSPAHVLTLGSDYTVTGGGYNTHTNMQTGSITVVSTGTGGVLANDLILIQRNVPINQLTSFQSGGALTAAMIEQALDKQATISQQLNELSGRSLRFQPGETLDGTLLLSARKGAFLAFDVNGNPVFPQSASIIYPSSAPLSVVNIAALRLLPVSSLVTGIPVQVAGYYAANDGGGGTYVWNSTSTTADNGGTVIQPTGVTTGRWMLQYGGSMNVRIFGAYGDGTHDDTAAIASALSAASIAGFPVVFPDGSYAVSSALTSSAVIQMSTGASLVPSGSGYTVLTIQNAPQFSTDWSVTIDSGASTVGARPALNGILWVNPVAIGVTAVRVNGLNGYGLKLQQMYDTTIKSISVELCGNATNYAFQITDGNDTSNTSFIAHLQVEQSQEKAISISGNSLLIHIGQIHSERATVSNPNTIVWDIQGNRCQYDCLRLSSNTPSNSVAQLFCYNTTYTDLLSEGAIMVTVQGYNGGACTLVNPEIQGTYNLASGQGGKVTVIGGNIASVTNYLRGATFYGAIIGSVSFNQLAQITECTFNTCTIGTVDSSSVVANAQFSGCTVTTFTRHYGCAYRVVGGYIGTLNLGDVGGGDETGFQATQVEIGTLAMQDGGSGGTFRSCQIDTFGTLNVPAGKTVFLGCILKTGVAVNYKTFVFRDMVINGNVSSDSGVIELYATKIIGTLTYASASAGIYDAASSVTGTVTNTGVNPYAGAWTVGQRTFNLIPTVGQPKSWVCTVAGSPGTWVSEGNL